MRLVRRFTSTQVRERRRKIVYIRLGICVGFILALGWLVVQALWFHTVVIQHVTFTGNKVLSTNELFTIVQKSLDGKYGFLIPRRSIFFFPKEKIQMELQEQFKRIESITIRRADFNEIKIAITERKPTTLWCASVDQLSETAPVEGLLHESQSNNLCYFMDATGFIFEKAPKFSYGLFVTFSGGVSAKNPIGQQFLDIQTLDVVLDFIDTLGAFAIHPVSIIDHGVYFQGVFSMAHNGQQFETEILFPKTDSYEKILQDIAVILESPEVTTEKAQPFLPIASIDVRFGNKVFYRVRE